MIIAVEIATLPKIEKFSEGLSHLFNFYFVAKVACLTGHLIAEDKSSLV